VLPTGLGKTETMLAIRVYRRLDRSLVLVPSDALRRQIAKKPEKPGDRRDVNRSRDAFGGDSSDCGCRHGYAASGAAAIAGSD
jgi:superfamily II DNA or RNA helicase